MMPRYADFFNVEQVCSMYVEVADGYIVPDTAYGEFILKIVDEKQNPFELRLLDVFYVPGLIQRLLSIPKFLQYGKTATIDECLVFNTTVQHDNNEVGHFKPLPFETLHSHLGCTNANTIHITKQMWG